MSTTLEKGDGTHVEHANMGTYEEAREVAAPELKITRESYWENKRAIVLCLIVSMAFLEFGLDQGTVNGFQVCDSFLCSVTKTDIFSGHAWLPIRLRVP
jgi:hypothetical protein